MNETYEKEISYMIAIPKYEDELKDPALIVSRLKNAKDFCVKNITSGEDETPVLEIEYKENTYTVEIGIETYEIPDMFRVVHFFKDIDLEAIGKQEAGLMVAMEFSDDILDSYHLQLKIVVQRRFCQERGLHWLLRVLYHQRQDTYSQLRRYTLVMMMYGFTHMD